MLNSLQSGSWATSQRLSAYPLMLIALYLAALAAWFATAHGLLDWMNRPLGTDFSEVWVSGGFVLDGAPAKPFDNEALFAAERAAFGSDTALFAWGYPPYFLSLAALFALLPYLWALLIWQTASGFAYVMVMRTIVPRRETIVLALAFPAVFVNLTHGHNGFLTAALMAGGLLALEKRPVLAGFLFACLAYKPQYGLLIPVALLCGQYWRAFGSAAVSFLALTLATLAAWGTAPWAAFVQSLTYSRVELLEQGNTGFYKMQSLFAAVRMLGGDVALAYIAQGALLVVLVLTLAVLWAKRVDWRLKSAALLTAAILATPYCLDYDMMVIAPAIAFVVAHGLQRGFAPYEKSLLAVVWFIPLIARTLAQTTLLPLGLLAMLALYGWVCWRALSLQKNHA